jgi:hypothetical protein
MYPAEHLPFFVQKFMLSTDLPLASTVLTASASIWISRIWPDQLPEP